MTEIRLQNPYMDETIKVKENYKLIRDMLEWLGRGNIDYLQLQQIEPDDSTNKFWRWLMSKDIDVLTILVNMHQFGYTVEKEAKYTVKIKGRLGQYLGKYYLNNEELTPQFTRTQYSEGGSFTRTELEANGFGWVFDCPGVEVKEVTDGND